jgi:hypothetical protein
MKNIHFLIFLYLLIGCSTKEQRYKKPNILLFIADDMSFSHMSHDGFPEVQTLNIDKLINTGVYFTNAYCAAPSCSPSRAAILTGRNGYELKEGAVLCGFYHRDFKPIPIFWMKKAILLVLPVRDGAQEILKMPVAAIILPGTVTMKSSIFLLRNMELMGKFIMSIMLQISNLS